MVVDLVTVSKYDVGASTLYVPQRVEADRGAATPGSPKLTTAETTRVAGSRAFVEAIPDAPADHRANLERLANWALALEDEGLATLWTSHGVTRKTLPLMIKGLGKGLATISSDNGGCLWLWRTVFQDRAPSSLQTVEALLDPDTVGHGTTVKGRDLSDELLHAVGDAYQEAAARG